MAYATTDALRTAMCRRQVPAMKGTTSLGNTGGEWGSGWALIPAGGVGWLAGATPASGSGETADANTVGAFPLSVPVAGLDRYLLRARARGIVVGGSLGRAFIIDRLVQTSGLVTNTAAAQTVNTVALPRFTSGDGVFLGLEVYNAIAPSPGNISASYTNEQGASGKITPTLNWTSVGVGNFLILPLADGDYGVRSVQSVTLAVAGGTAGNFGVTLFKPILMLNMGDDSNADDWTRDWRFTGLPKIHDNACLNIICRVFTPTPGWQLDLLVDYA